MILQSLEAFYNRLAEEGDESLVLPGFSRQNITFRVELKLDGSLVGIFHDRDESGKKPVPKKVLVLGASKPSGQGINPCFLWDNTAYMLGFKPNDDKPDRTRLTFEAFREKHIALREEISSPEFDAVCHFLAHWNQERAADFPILAELAPGFGVFKIFDQTCYVHQNPVIESWWKAKLNSEIEVEGESANGERMQCLVTGQESPIARIHEPKIQGVNGAQAAGALLVSFNFDAAESYGRVQSLVAPVGKDVAFRYAVALNRLLDRAGKRRFQIGDASAVYWTARQSPAEQLFPWMIDTGSVEDETLKSKLHDMLYRLSRGQYAEDLGPQETDFYILGLSPNVARISVRFWWRGSVAEVAKRIGEHFEDLSITKPATFNEFPGLWEILRETARESKDIPPNLSGAMMRSILQGIEYPTQLFQTLMRRIKADHDISPVRVAAIKAHLNRQFRLGNHLSPLKGSLEMSLNKDRPESAYHLGRLFAVLEKTQEDAFKGQLNATIKDRFFSSASATPAAVFPRLIRMNQHHVNKLDRKEWQVAAEKRMQEIMERIDSFPRFLTMPEQGLFAIGYYHQRQDFFIKKEDNAQPA
jgi:CRISPR-associated protein Csd1